MVEDVYSGDDNQRRVGQCAFVHVPLAFHVLADAAPDTLARIFNILALSNLSPLSCRAAAHAGDHMDITVQFGRFPETVGESLVRKLRQLTCVIEADISAQADFSEITGGSTSSNGRS
jgi:uncharacterized protein (DUF924 family)